MEEALGWGLFFLGAGIAIAGHGIGSGFAEFGDEIRRGMEELARAWEYTKEREEDE